MIFDTHDSMTIGEVFKKAREAYGDNTLLSSIQKQSELFSKSYTYAEAYKLSQNYSNLLYKSGYGHGHRIALLIGNVIEYFIYKIAFSNIGASCVPINPDYLPKEISYVLLHSEVELIITTSEYLEKVDKALISIDKKPNLVVLNSYFQIDKNLPKAINVIPINKPVNSKSESSILYTSGSTSNPKGCVLSHEYELMSGFWYVARKGLINLNDSREKIFNPLPVHHINSSVFSFFAAMLSGNCQIVIDRFHPSTFWEDVVNTQASIIHYLGIMAPILINQKITKWESMHKVRLGIGAGIDPSLHKTFEKRFKFPMVEIWGMTEMVRCMFADIEPRQVGTRAFGRPEKELQVKIIDDKNNEIIDDSCGEMLIRHSKKEPRKYFFTGYLKDPESTEKAWEGGWFHTGDIVYKDKYGILHFVDRKKNIIRRSGENISAAEVENIIQSHNKVNNVTVVAVKDEIREEEVLACIILKGRYDGNYNLAEELFLYCLNNLSYYKVPGWILFLKKLPITSTNKIAKHKVLRNYDNPIKLKNVFDFRNLKKRNTMKNK